MNLIILPIHRLLDFYLPIQNLFSLKTERYLDQLGLQDEVYSIVLLIVF
jgi:hypothetical protein